LDGDNNSIEPKALLEACEAKTATDDAFQKMREELRATGNLRRYGPLFNKAHNDMEAKALKVIPKLKPKRDALDRDLNNINSIPTDAPPQERADAYGRWMDRHQRYIKKLVSTLERLCSPPSA
jgi:hypothetical protein